MSFISSGRKSSTPSILKKPGRPRSFPVHTVKFQLDCSLKTLLESFVNEKNRDSYVELIHKIRDSGEKLKDDELIKLISEARDCMSILIELKLFVQVILLLKWVHRGDEVVQHYKNFVLDLCSAHNYFTNFALKQLVSTFEDVNPNSLHQVCYPSEQEEIGFQHAHDVIRSILKLIPMSKNVLLNRIQRKFPFRTANPRIYLNFTHNILHVCSYEPSLRKDILALLFIKLIHLDTMCSKEDIEKSETSNVTEVKNVDESVFSMEVDDVLEVEEDMKNETARKLDFCIHRICKYIYTECHDENGSLKREKMKSLFQDFSFVFETVIMPTCGAVHLPFVMLYLISFECKRAEEFMDYLWKKVENIQIAGPIRQSAVYYLAGILSHASFLNMKHFTVLKSFMLKMERWLSEYIDKTNCTKGEDTDAFIRTHAVFYAVCQSLFYLVNTRHPDLINDIKFLENLNLGKIVSSSLNPLLVCKPSIVNNFARVARKYELTYCFTLLSGFEKISSACSDCWLDGSFPFECFLLKRSYELIRPIHRPVENVFDKELLETNSNDMEEDFIPGSLSHTPDFPVLGTSPFFGCMSG